MKRMIWFDMDGTLNQFYDVPNWLPKLRSYDPSPYAEASVMHNMSRLARYLNRLQKMGYGIGIISWLAKDSTPDYDWDVTVKKYGWLFLHLESVEFNAIHITKYGVPKESFKVNENDILFDDNNGIRDDWGVNAYPPESIFDVLKELVHAD